MWAQRLIAPGQFEKTEVADLTEADVPDGQVLLRTLAGGICGSDLPTFRGGAFPHPRDAGGIIGRVPGLPMHEVAGEVLVSKDPGLAVGDHVVGWASNFDAIAQYTVSDGQGLQRYDTALAATTAIAIQPLACVLYAVDQMGPVAAGSHAAVLGQGPIGLLFSHVLHDRGVSVTGVDRVNRERHAAVFGVGEAVHAAADRWVASLGPAERPPLVVEAVGHQVSTMRYALEAAAVGGQVFYFGVPDDWTYPLDMLSLFRKNLTLRAGWTMDRRREVLQQAAGYFAAHPELQEHYVSHVYKADEVQTAFEAACAPKPGQYKVVLDMVA
jgi:L-iditol 2-dehydrogenase